MTRDLVQSGPPERSASLVRIGGGTERLYRCDECRALLRDGEDARAHLWWHDRLLYAPDDQR